MTTPISPIATRGDLIVMIHNRDNLVSDLKKGLEGAEARAATLEQHGYELVHRLEDSNDILERLLNAEQALRTIANGSFPGASNLAISGSWKIFVDNLQAIARAALPAAPEENKA